MLHAHLRRLELDFVRARRRSRWAGALLLGLAVALGAQAGLSYVRVEQTIAEAEARLAKQPRAATRRAAPEELTAARDTVQRLSLPWGELFAALESAAGDRVALLAIEPDPRTGTVTISGDAKDYLAALSYVLQLRRAQGLADVQLARHELKSGDPQKPVAFSVTASWRNP